MVRAIPSAARIEFAKMAEQGRHGGALNEDGESYDGEGDGNDRLALRKIRRKSQSQRERKSAPQAAPEENVLVIPAYARGRARGGSEAEVNCGGAT